MLLTRLKEVAEDLPEPVAQIAVRIPFSWRLGRTYTAMRREIVAYAQLDEAGRRDYAFMRFRRIVEFALEHNPFYRDFYRSKGFEISSLRGLDDVARVPIVTKDDLRSVPLAQRVTPGHGRFRINTGGTSGAPLEFYLDKDAWAREWAHNHHIWEQFGYRYTDIKLTFRGKNIGDQPLRFNAVHNEFVVSAYHGFDEVAKALRDVLRKRAIRYFHGYPSIISEFARYCKEDDPSLVQEFRDLRGVFLASEFPAPVYRSAIEQTFKVPTLSWYGHSEMAVIAPEIGEQFRFYPLHTYGFCEAVKGEADDWHLVGTSYYNTATPFIRYDTSDIIEPQHRDEFVESFRVTQGRVGDYILDKHGRRISLTALVFGRHHPLFGIARFVQVKQDTPGKATILATLPAHVSADSIDWEDAFDITDVAIEFSFETRNEPVRTPVGKVPLLVK